MSRYGYLKVFQRVPWNSRQRESSVFAPDRTKDSGAQEINSYLLTSIQNLKKKCLEAVIFYYFIKFLVIYTALGYS